MDLMQTNEINVNGYTGQHDIGLKCCRTDAKKTFKK